MYYSIGEMAKKMNVNALTLRFYDRNGLLPFVTRDEAGRRQFKENDIGLLEVITRMKQIGIPVKDIAKFVEWTMGGDETMQARYDYLDEQEQVLEEKIKQFEDNLDFIRFKKWYYKTSIAAGTERIHYEEGSTDVSVAKEMAKFQAQKKTVKNIHDLIDQ